jgi:hypothetical protein
MPLVTPTQLTALRNIAFRGLDTPFTVWRVTRVENAYGTSEGPLAQVSSGMCWLRMMNKPRLGEQVMQIAATSVYRLHTTLDVDIEVGDEVRAFGNDKYIVQDVNNDDTIQVFRTAILRRVD